MAQTAVEWLVNKLNTEFIRELPIYRWSEVFNLVEKAKEMEKQQIMKAYKDYHDLGHIYGLKTEQYYNETFTSIQQGENPSATRTEQS